MKILTRLPSSTGVLERRQLGKGLEDQCLGYTSILLPLAGSITLGTTRRCSRLRRSSFGPP